jgi:HSP20 family protein
MCCRLDIKDVGNNELMATIELPGLNKENVNIDVHNDRLTISGETESAQSETSEGGYSVRERSYGKFTRSLPLPRGTKVSV